MATGMLNKLPHSSYSVSIQITTFLGLLILMPFSLKRHSDSVPYLSALEVCSRQGAIQIHVYLTLPLLPVKQLKRAGVSHSQLHYFFLVVIRPVLEYVSSVWHHLINKAQTDQTEAIQRKAIRIINFDYTYGMPYTNALYM